jgi:hypothetical protein
MGPNFKIADEPNRQADYNAAGLAHNRLMGFAEPSVHEQRKLQRPTPAGI